MLLIVIFLFDIREVLSEPATEISEQETRQFETQRIYIDELNKAVLNNKPVESLDALLAEIKNLELGDPLSTLVVVRFHKDAKHKVFVKVTDTLDEAGYEKRVEVLMLEKD